MVPDKFNMVDMEGIDIITSQGEAVEGLYQKLVESIAQCRYQCLYNWKFDGILIPPTYVEMEIIDDVVWINEGVSVDEEDVIRIYSLEPPSPEPELIALSVQSNGDYLPPSGYDGFSSVSVSVPEATFETLSVTENGTYYPSNADGFSSVNVDVQSAAGDMEEWVFTGSDPTAGHIHGRIVTANNVVFSSSGASFGSNNSFLSQLPVNNGMTFEVYVGECSITAGAHRRFIMGTDDSGFIYRSTGKWAFYAGSWVESNETDPDFFSNSTIKIYIDTAGYWHIYKNGVLWWEPSTVLNASVVSIGSSSYSCIGVMLNGIKIL